MKFILFVAVIIVAVCITWVAFRRGKIEMVAHAHLLSRTWSVWLASIGSAMGAWAQSFPSSAITAWTGLPEDVKTVLPQHYLGFIASFMVAMAVIAQFVRQKKLLAQHTVEADQNTSNEGQKA
ncbi:hypothetical protein [Erwinia sp. 9145]|uniref:DUF7940 domain-containing protein n=1 Tax=Erwinia sp. 9145 TaxID=1500895 RepID=UPI00054D4A16|nr:hypothetical protein [Erwinia sp. 9145]